MKERPALPALNDDFHDFLLSLTEIDGVSFERAIQDPLHTTVDGLNLPFLGRDALLANKRAAGRPKDLADVETLLALAPR